MASASQATAMSQAGNLDGSPAAPLASLTSVDSQSGDSDSCTGEASFPFTAMIYVLKPEDNTEGGAKEGLLLTLDTGCDVNIISHEAATRCGIPIEAPDDLRPLEPFQLCSGNTERITPAGYARNVEWHFAKWPRTLKGGFYVVDTGQYDMLLGGPSIGKHRLLQPDPSLPATAVRSRQAVDQPWKFT